MPRRQICCLGIFPESASNFDHETFNWFLGVAEAPPETGTAFALLAVKWSLATKSAGARRIRTGYDAPNREG